MNLGELCARQLQDVAGDVLNIRNCQSLMHMCRSGNGIKTVLASEVDAFATRTRRMGIQWTWQHCVQISRSAALDKTEIRRQLRLANESHQVAHMHAHTRARAITVRPASPHLQSSSTMPSASTERADPKSGPHDRVCCRPGGAEPEAPSGQHSNPGVEDMQGEHDTTRQDMQIGHNT